MLKRNFTTLQFTTGMVSVLNFTWELVNYKGVCVKLDMSAVQQGMPLSVCVCVVCVKLHECHSTGSACVSVCVLVCVCVCAKLSERRSTVIVRVKTQ